MERFSEAIGILAAGDDTNERWQWALYVAMMEVLGASQTGNPDGTLMDWVAAYGYDGSETVTTLADEWDSSG